MRYSIIFSPDADKALRKYKKSNPIRFKKVAALLNDIAEHPRTGVGHPEALVNGNDSIYFRRISGQDRMIYEIIDETIIVNVVSLEGHYNDK